MDTIAQPSTSSSSNIIDKGSKTPNIPTLINIKSEPNESMSDNLAGERPMDLSIKSSMPIDVRDSDEEIDTIIIIDSDDDNDNNH